MLHFSSQETKYRRLDGVILKKMSATYYYLLTSLIVHILFICFM